MRVGEVSSALQREFVRDTRRFAIIISSVETIVGSAVCRVNLRVSDDDGL